MFITNFQNYLLKANLEWPHKQSPYHFSTQAYDMKHVPGQNPTKTFHVGIYTLNIKKSKRIIRQTHSRNSSHPNITPIFFSLFFSIPLLGTQILYFNKNGMLTLHLISPLICIHIHSPSSICYHFNLFIYFFLSYIEKKRVEGEGDIM